MILKQLAKLSGPLLETVPVPILVVTLTDTVRRLKNSTNHAFHPVDEIVGCAKLDQRLLQSCRMQFVELTSRNETSTHNHFGT